MWHNGIADVQSLALKNTGNKRATVSHQARDILIQNYCDNKSPNDLF